MTPPGTRESHRDKGEPYKRFSRDLREGKSEKWCLSYVWKMQQAFLGMARACVRALVASDCSNEEYVE
jgi:hypothetical protein